MSFTLLSIKYYSVTKDAQECVYEYAHDLPLNESNIDILVTLVKYKEINIENNKITFSSSWATDFNVNESNVETFIQVARSRWKIENETFNTLRNQGYNFVHGNATLTNMLILMLVVFFMDQIQQATSKYFREALNFTKSKKALL